MTTRKYWLEEGNANKEQLESRIMELQEKVEERDRERTK